MYLQGRHKYLKKPLSLCKCDHPAVTHYTQDGYCVFNGCGCIEFRVKGNHKYNSTKAVCVLGHAHDSGLEVKTCFDLSNLKKAEEIEDFSFHTVIDLHGQFGTKVCTYEIDFIVNYKDGITEYLECKGRHLLHEGLWRLKWKLLQDKYRENPKIIFRVVTD